VTPLSRMMEYMEYIAMDYQDYIMRDPKSVEENLLSEGPV